MANLPVPDDARVWAEAEALRDAGLEVQVICPALRGHPAGRRRVNDIDVRYLKLDEGVGLLGTMREIVGFAFRVYPLIIFTLLSKRFVLFQVCNPPDVWWPLLLLARLRRCNAIYDQHDVVPLLAKAKGWTFVYKLMSIMERATVGSANKILVPSEKQLTRMRLKYNRSAELVRSPLPMPDAPSVRKPKDDDTIRILYAGVIGEQDGVSVAVEAFAIFKRDAMGIGKRAILEIAGDGPALTNVRSTRDKLEVVNDVTLHGWVKPAEVVSLATRAHALIVPDPVTEFNDMCAMNKVILGMAVGSQIVMTPCAENVAMAGAGAFVAESDSAAHLAKALLLMASASPEDLVLRAKSLRTRYNAHLSWDRSRVTYVQAVCADDRLRRG